MIETISENYRDPDPFCPKSFFRFLALTKPCPSFQAFAIPLVKLDFIELPLFPFLFQYSNTLYSKESSQIIVSCPFLFYQSTQYEACSRNDLGKVGLDLLLDESLARSR